MLKFLFGRPGSGKTSKIIEMIKASVAMKKKTYFLVPEQQAFISESMLAQLPPSSMLYFEVISFSRLCEIVFGLYGGLTDNHVSSGIRQLIMWQSLRELMPIMQQYQNTRADSALGSMMLSTIDELNANLVSPEMLEELSSKCPNNETAKKLSDIAAIYSAFRENIAKRLGEEAIASENKLAELAKILAENNTFSGCDIYVDSFISFTAAEIKILEELILQADTTCISFCVDGYDSQEPHLTSITDTAKHFRLFAKRRDISVSAEHLKDNTRANNQELRILEKYLWDFSVTENTMPKIAESQRGNIEMTACKNEYEEACFAALRILAERKKGMKYSEIAVIMRHCDNRKGIISAVFERFGIPFFYSERTDLSSTPAARLILSALRCVIYNFQASDILTLLKTGLCNIDPIDADLFEDYCYTWNINGSKFTEELWSMNPDGYTKEKSERGNKILLKANLVRQTLIPPLVNLKQELAKSEGNTVACCRAIYNYLEKINLSDTLSSLAEFEINSGNVREAGEMLRVYDYIISLLTKISRVLEEDNLSIEELSCALEIMLKNTDIGSVPSVNDYVTVGSADTLRVENIKMAILLGLCEGEFPAAYSDSGILNENDKSFLEDLGISLSSRENKTICDELFHVYRAMTKCSEKLVLCTVSSHIEGGALTPSSAWNRVAFIFGYIKKFDFDLDRIKARSMVTEASSDAPDDGKETIDAPLFNEGPVMDIDPMYVKMLFGDRLSLTKSRISAFAECPYKYWCEYILKLRETKPAAVSYADSGTIIHYILEHFLSRVKNSDGSLKPLSDEETVDLINELMNDYISEINCPLPPSLMYTFSRLRDLTLVMVKDVIDEFANSKFKIVAMEKSISDKQSDALKPMEIKVNDDADSPVVLLGGVIDRLDCYDDGEQKYLRVVDYKTGTHKYSVDKIATGKDLQLPAYLFTAALEENRDFFGENSVTFPASALFLSAEEASGKINPVRSGFLLGDINILQAASATMDKNKLAGVSINKQGKVSGKAAVSKSELEEINNTMQSTIANTAKNMYSGKAPRTPSKDACGFCSLRSSCPVACKEKNGN